MAWDDTPPDDDLKQSSTTQAASGWDATPPDPDLAAKSLSGFGSNLVQDVKGSVQGIGDLVKGLATHPIDTAEAIPGALVNEGKRIGLGELLTGHPINAAEKFGNAAYDKPLTTAFDVAPVVGAAGKALGIGGAAGEGAGAAADVAKAAETAEEATPAAETAKAVESAPGAIPEPMGQAPNLKDLPVMQPGAKTGAPHALFAYNDTFGPDQAPRSIYNIFGDPTDPQIVSAGGHGSSVPKDILDQAGIPVVGREPRSVGKWEPLDTPKIPPAGGPEAAGAPPSSGKPPILDTAAKAAQDALDQAKELKDYVSKGYSGYAKKPGALADVADWVQEKSQMMAAQQIGVTPNQARQLGKTPLAAHNAMRAIGQYALDHDIVSPGTGLSGMLEKNAELTKSVGKTIGDYRAMADKLAGEVDPKEMVAEVRKVLDDKYMRGVTEESGPRGAYGGQAGTYQRALQELEDADPSHSGMAEASTELNHAANKAAKNMQPETPYTDVANAVSQINNEKIKALIGKDNAAKYEQALREFGVNKKIANALKFKASGEVKRFGPGSIGSNLTQKAMDEVGYRFGAKAANKLSTAIKNNPSVAGNLPSLFKEFINQVEDVGHDVTGMATGGIVPDDVRRFVSSR